MLEKEKNKNLNGEQHADDASAPLKHAPGWNQNLSSTSEAHVKVRPLFPPSFTTWFKEEGLMGDDGAGGPAPWLAGGAAEGDRGEGEQIVTSPCNHCWDDCTPLNQSVTGWSS